MCECAHAISLAEKKRSLLPLGQVGKLEIYDLKKVFVPTEAEVTAAATPQ